MRRFHKPGFVKVSVPSNFRRYDIAGWRLLRKVPIELDNMADHRSDTLALRKWHLRDKQLNLFESI